jgi:hypothetical protein
MKKILLATLVLLSLPVFLGAQSKEINEIFDRYEKKKSVESITISPSLLSMSNTQETRELGAKISNMRILNVPLKATESGQSVSNMLKNELERIIKNFQFQRAVKVEEEDSLFELYMINGNKGVVLFISSDSSDFTAISIFGDIDKTIVNSLLNGNIKVKK